MGEAKELTKKKKKAFKMPHTLVIIFMIIFAAVLFTWVVPSGAYVRFEDAVTGRNLIDPESFHYVENTPVNPLNIMNYVIDGFMDAADLIFMLMFAGGAFHLITESGALQASIAKVARKFSNRFYIFIPMLTLIFTLIATNQGVNLFIPFVPITVMLSFALGLDSLVGVSIILLGGAVGFSTGTLQTSTTLLAQEIAGLVPFSGIWYRAICLVVFWVVTNLFLIRYAMKIKKNPQLSPMYDLDLQSEMKASTTDLSTVLGLIEQNKPALAIVDSAQTIVSQEVDGISGGSTQVREVASALIDTAKTLDIPVFLVGHVTKDGSIAGPRTLEHLVDVVCQFEGDSETALRMLRAVKNRFGPTDEVGCFDMSGEGIEEVTDPAGLFLSGDGPDAANAAPVEGTCVTFTLDGHRSLPIEVQALVTTSVLPTPRRAVNGVDPSRIAMLVAVLYRHSKLNLLSNDLYISTIAGGQAKEPGSDLAIVAALASAATSKPIARATCAIGEISLTGQVRPVPRMEYRLREAARLGFTTAVIPPLRKPVHVEGLQLVESNTLSDALDALGVRK